MIQLENWVEKYMPLKIHKQISDALAHTLESSRSMGKLLEYDREITKHLRKTILDDIGNPRLKKDMLDLIQKLETGQHVKHAITMHHTLEQQQPKIQMQRTMEGGVQPVKKETFKIDTGAEETSSEEEADKEKEE
jgi:hypothetical protein